MKVYKQILALFGCIALISRAPVHAASSILPNPAYTFWLKLCTEINKANGDGFLLENDHNNAIDANLYGPLHCAAENGHVLSLRFLAVYGDVDSPTNQLKTPLHFAAANGHLNAVRELLSLGANQNNTDREGRKPIDYAKNNNHQEIVQLLAPNDTPSHDFLGHSLLGLERPMLPTLSDESTTITPTTESKKVTTQAFQQALQQQKAQINQQQKQLEEKRQGVNQYEWCKAMERSSTVCPVCSRVFAQGRQRGAHIKRDHKGEKITYTCTFSDCNYTAKNQNGIQFHLRARHSSTNPYKCLLCTTYCANRRDHIIIHTKKYHQGLSPKFTYEQECRLCNNYVAKDEKELIDHVVNKCPQRCCGDDSTSDIRYQQLSQHEWCKHMATYETHYCHMCQETFANTRLRTDHYRLNHDNAQPVHQCPVSECSFSGKVKYSIKGHLQSHHTTKTPYQCPICRVYQAVRKGNVKEHIKKMHPKRKNAQPKYQQNCEQCTRYIAASEKELIQHVLEECPNRPHSSAGLPNLRSTDWYHQQATLLLTAGPYTKAVQFPINSDPNSSEPLPLSGLLELSEDDIAKSTFSSPKRTHEQGLEQTTISASSKAHASNSETEDGMLNQYEWCKAMDEFDIKCPLCAKKFTTKYKKSGHLRAQHMKEKTIYQCTAPGCDYKHATSTCVQRHLRTGHTQAKPYMCSMENCLRSTAQAPIKKHITRHHQNSPAEVTYHQDCSQCQNYTATSEKQLILHVLRKCSNKPHEESKEPAAPKKMQARKRKIPSNMSAEKNMSKKQKSGYSAKQQYRILSQVEWCRAMEEYAKNCCSICQKCFSDRKTLLSHLKKMHHQLKPIIPCPASDCTYTDPKYNRIQEHLKKEHQESSAPYICPLCTKTRSLYPSNIQAHIKEVHADQSTKPIYQKDCQQCCNYTATKEEALINHVLYECSNKPLGRKKAANVPLSKQKLSQYNWCKAMDEYKKNRCHICKQTFASVHLQNAHYQLDHNIKRDCHCPVPACSYQHPKVQKVEEHMRAKHTHEASYHCSVCHTYKNAYKSTVVAHTKQNHPEQRDQKPTYQQICEQCSTYTATSEANLIQHVLRECPNRPDEATEASVTSATSPDSASGSRKRKARKPTSSSKKSAPKRVRATTLPTPGNPTTAVEPGYDLAWLDSISTDIEPTTQLKVPSPSCPDPFQGIMDTPPQKSANLLSGLSDNSVPLLSQMNESMTFSDDILSLPNLDQHTIEDPISFAKGLLSLEPPALPGTFAISPRLDEGLEVAIESGIQGLPELNQSQPNPTVLNMPEALSMLQNTPTSLEALLRSSASAQLQTGTQNSDQLFSGLCATQAPYNSSNIAINLSDIPLPSLPVTEEDLEEVASRYL